MTMQTAPHPNDTGMARIAAILSDQTCGEACWNAREEICRCSCGGLNHGCLKDKNGKAPARSAKIDGFPYVLIGVGSYGDMASEGRKLNSHEIAGYKSVSTVTTCNAGVVEYHYEWHDTDHGAPARVKPASKAQLAGWLELAGWKKIVEEKPWTSVYLLWKKVESLQDAARMSSVVPIA